MRFCEQTDFVIFKNKILENNISSTWSMMMRVISIFLVISLSRNCYSHNTECVHFKQVGTVTYQVRSFWHCLLYNLNLLFVQHVNENPGIVEKYGCKNGCIYEQYGDDDKTRFCFADGQQDVKILHHEECEDCSWNYNHSTSALCGPHNWGNLRNTFSPNKLCFPVRLSIIS